MSFFRVLRGKLRRKVVVFCLVSSLLLFIYVSLRLLTTHESDAIAISNLRLSKRDARDRGGGGRGGGDDAVGGGDRDVIPPPLHQQFHRVVGGSNKTDLNQVIVPYKVRVV